MNSQRILRRLVSRLRPSDRRRRRTSVPLNSEPLETRVLPATIIVTSLDDTLADDDQVTLREAIAAADTDSSVSGSAAGDGADTIQFAAGLTGTVQLNGTQLEIASEITIQGPAQHRLSIDGNGASRVLQILNSAVVHIDGVTILNGATDEGGGIRNDGTLSVSNSTLTSNTAAFDGGAIDNFGTLTLTSTTLHNNTSSGYGGGIYNWGTLNVDRSSIHANSADFDGGGIASVGDLAIANSTISLNSTEFGNGGGIQTDGPMTLIGSTLIGNRASRDVTGNGTGGGIAALSTTSFVMHNTVIANSLTGPDSVLVSNDIATPAADVVDPASSNNLVSVDSGFNGISNGTNGNQIGTSASPLDPLLSDLNSTAGLFAHTPLAGSPLLDAGSDNHTTDSFGNDQAFDQIGIARVSNIVDIGAIEVDPQVSVSFDGSRHVVQIVGTQGNDMITIVPNNSPRITLNGTNHKFDAHRLMNPLFEIDGAEGTDQLRVELSAAADTVVLRPLEVDVHGMAFNVAAASMENIVVDGAGGNDTVTFEDSDGNDTFVGNRDVAWMTGSGFTNTARNFETISAESTAGSDTAQLSTSNGLASYSATPTRVQFVSDLSHYDLASFVETDTWLLGTVDPDSRADFYDSVNNDAFESTPAVASLRGIGFDHAVIGSPVNRAHSTVGGTDTAIFHDSAGDDLFVAKPEYGLMRPASGNSYYSFAAGFDTLIAHASTGHDSMQVYDSNQDDTLVSTESYVVMRGGDYYAQANGFDVRDVYSTRGGYDRAQLFDSSGSNHFVAQGSIASMSDSDGEPTTVPSWKTTTAGFSHILAIATAGGQNEMDWSGPLGYAFVRQGDWNING